MKNLLTRITCKHEYHSRGTKTFYRNGKTMKKNMYICFKCGKNKVIVEPTIKSLNKVRV